MFEIHPIEATRQIPRENCCFERIELFSSKICFELYHTASIPSEHRSDCPDVRANLVQIQNFENDQALNWIKIDWLAQSNYCPIILTINIQNLNLFLQIHDS